MDVLLLVAEPDEAPLHNHDTGPARYGNLAGHLDQCLGQPAQHDHQTRQALLQQVQARLVARVHKERQAKGAELPERQPRRQEAMPMEVGQREESGEEVTGLLQVEFEKHLRRQKPGRGKPTCATATRWLSHCRTIIYAAHESMEASM